MNASTSIAALQPSARLSLDVDRIEAIAARLDLRRPNRDALESIVVELHRYFRESKAPPPFEAVVDSATGVGKTYIMASVIEYLAADGLRNFAVIAPGRTILDKTVANFTPGHPKSLLGGMDVNPVVITSENFTSAAMRAAMDDPAEVKLFIFTVQSLLRPTSKTGRKTHKFQEGLGDAFYAHLQQLDDLAVMADEHHAYFGKEFSRAIGELHPWSLIGLTATPDKRTPPDQIIFRYPLAAAIAEKLVKTPVLVGRQDDRSDPPTKLLDGVRLLELKERAIIEWCTQTGTTPIPPMMLVVAPNIDEAREIERIVSEPAFAGGRYAGKVLRVDSSQSDEALAALDGLEVPGCPYRIVVSVGMLKEGWDVKNVYVIASLRASVSEILTEQTLGRGMRLPFGQHTGVEILDTLEVLGHERYEQLLQQAGVLNQRFIDHRVRSLLRRDAEGQFRAVVERETVAVPVVPASAVDGDATVQVDGDQPTKGTITEGEPPATAAIASLDAQLASGEAQVQGLRLVLPPRSGPPPLRIPQLKMTTVKSNFSLADITDYDPFRKLGERIATDPQGTLRRVQLSARIVTGPDGMRRTELVPVRAEDRVESQASLFPLDELKQRLTEQVLGSPVVPARTNQRAALAPIIEAFLRGLGSRAERSLSAYLDRAAAGLIQLLAEEQRKYAVKPSFGEVVELATFGPLRTGRAETSADRYSAFKKGTGFTSYAKSLYAQDWFDSAPEREVANTLEDADTMTLWVRLQQGDLPILWTGAGREYNPDFIAIEKDSTHWVVEVKMDKEMTSEEVLGKRAAAQRWANYVSADEAVSVRWRYLLVSETDVKTAKGYWQALRGLGNS